MDPLSITASCVGLLSSITSLSKKLSDFVRHARDARKDIDIVRQDIASLSILVEHLEVDTEDPDVQYPDHLKHSLIDVLQGCDDTITEMSLLVSKVSLGSVGRQVQWALTGKNEMDKLRIRLEGFKSTINFAVNMITWLILTNVKNDTTVIKEDTAAIKQGNEKIQQYITQLLSEISELKEKISRAETCQLPTRDRNFVLQRFLDESTSYAETVMNESLCHMMSDLESGADNSQSLVQTEFSLSANFLPDKSSLQMTNKENKTGFTDIATEEKPNFISLHPSNKPESFKAPLPPESGNISIHASSSRQPVTAGNSQQYERPRTMKEEQMDYKIRQLFEKPPKWHTALPKLLELIEGGADISNVPGSALLFNTLHMHYHTALQAAILTWPSDTLIVDYLLDSGADVNAQCECDAPRSCHTALRAAVIVGSVGTVSHLLKRGADANARRDEEFTLLHIAALRLDRDIMAQLIIHGASTSALADIDHDAFCKGSSQNKSLAVKSTPLWDSLYALNNLDIFDNIPGASKRKVSVLMVVAYRCRSAASHQKVEKVTDLLLTYETDKNNEREYLTSVLEDRIAFGCQICIHLLLDRGASVDIESSSFLHNTLRIIGSSNGAAFSCASDILKQATGKLGKNLCINLIRGIDDLPLKTLETAALKADIRARYLRDSVEKQPVSSS